MFEDIRACEDKPFGFYLTQRNKENEEAKIDSQTTAVRNFSPYTSFSTRSKFDTALTFRSVVITVSLLHKKL